MNEIHRITPFALRRIPFFRFFEAARLSLYFLFLIFPASPIRDPAGTMLPKSTERAI